MAETSGVPGMTPGEDAATIGRAHTQPGPLRLGLDGSPHPCCARCAEGADGKRRS